MSDSETENAASAGSLFMNVRKAVRLLYEYQKRMQGTMFHIKSVLGLSNAAGAGRITVNKLFSYHPKKNKNEYGTFSLVPANWAWDYIFPMALEYHLGEKDIPGRRMKMSVIQVTDDGYFRALRQGQRPDRKDTSTFALPEESATTAVFITEVKATATGWSKRWQRDKMENALNRWMKDSRETIVETTSGGNLFAVIKIPVVQLIDEKSVGEVINRINALISG